VRLGFTGLDGCMRSFEGKNGLFFFQSSLVSHIIYDTAITEILGNMYLFIAHRNIVRVA